MGYHRAGFEVVGVDIKPQPNYPFEFHQADALTFPLDGFDAIHASPPCQHFTRYRNVHKDIHERYEDLIDPTRFRLRSAHVPYVIENVEGSPLKAPVKLCGSMFGLEVRRHRLFESNMPLVQPECDHSVWVERKYPGSTGRARRFTCEVGVWRIPLAEQRAAMGDVSWMQLRELSESIPPAYTEYIGRQLLDALVGRKEPAA